MLKKNQIKKTLKKIAWKLSGGYKPEKFWNQFAETLYQDPWQHGIYTSQKWLLKHIKKAKPQSILEVGCGFGRNIKFFIDHGIKPEVIIGVDISDNLLKKAKAFIGNKKVRLKHADICDLPFKDRSLDIVITHGVLMHVSSAVALEALIQMKRVSSKAILVVEQNYPADNDYTFLHDYKKLFKQANLEIIEYNSDRDIGLDMIYGQIRKRS